MNLNREQTMKGTCDGCGKDLCAAHNVCHDCAEGEPDLGSITGQVEEFAEHVKETAKIAERLQAGPEMDWQAYIPGGTAAHRAWGRDLTVVTHTLKRAVMDGARDGNWDAVRLLGVALTMAELNLGRAESTLINGKPAVALRFHGPLPALENALCAVVAASQSRPKHMGIRRVLGALLTMYRLGMGKNPGKAIKPHLKGAMPFPAGTAVVCRSIPEEG